MSDLPVPKVPQLSRFGPAAIDRAINRTLAEQIPDAHVALLDITLTNAEGERLLSGVVAANFGDGWGAALGGTLDLQDRDDWVVGVSVRKSL